MLEGETEIRLTRPRQRAAREKAPRGSRGALAVPDADEALFERLRALRREIASEQGVPAYVVFADRSLMDMAARRPRTREQFLECHGVGLAKLEKYGDAFLAAIGEGE